MNSFRLCGAAPSTCICFVSFCAYVGITAPFSDMFANSWFSKERGYCW